ncbi:MAG: fimbrial biogenesis usher protein [Kluyvera sp.]|uniref:fimbrial biogenesis usher protein n=1 Tax=Kluyvera sp. TaxID=1538228 RepID=UPI003F3F1C24
MLLEVDAMMRRSCRATKPSLPTLALAVASALTIPRSWADNYFNPAFLSDDPSAVADLSTFSRNVQAPGVYRVDVYLNDALQSSQDLQFNAATPAKASDDKSGLSACLTTEMLQKMGVNVAGQPALARSAPADCVDLAAAIPDATSRFDFAQQRLNISIPQAALVNNARGYIPPENWDEGVNALLLNYTYTGSKTHDRSAESSAQTNQFLGLNSGLNIGAWRLRDYSTWNDSSGQNSQADWQHISTYLERDIAALKSEMTVGDSYTPSGVFDSLPFRGIQIASDDNMLPDSMKGFAPTIRGIARSNAQVTIRQNGYIINQRYVPPGAFTFSDLYPTASSGDLVVEVKESDGSTHSYNVPYSAVPVLQREGRLKYAATVAEYRGDSSQKEDTQFGQATLMWGLPKGVTLYGGMQFSNNYKAIALGSGANLGDWGALSLDITQAYSTLVDGSDHEGQSLRLLYAKSLSQLGTNLQLLGYRYSTSSFYTLDETTWKHMSGYNGQTDDDDARADWANYYDLYYTKRGKVQLNITQPLAQFGSFFITASRESYWHTDETNSLLQLGYSATYKGISWSLSYNSSRSPGESESDRIVALNISLPLSQWLSHDDDITHERHNAYATFNTSSDRKHNVTESAGINGTLLDENNLSYSVQQGMQNHGGGESGAASMEYDGSRGNVNVGYNVNNNGDYQQVNYGLSGGVVVHSHGVTLSQPLGNTNILIAAPGAAEVGIEDEPGIHTDGRGYAVIPYATTYRLNRTALNVNTLADNVDIDDAVTNVVPTEGALALAHFDAHVGVRALLNLRYHDKAVPFGATVSANQNTTESIVGDDGETYLSGLIPQGMLHVRWGKLANQRCDAPYQLPESTRALVRQKVECR